MKINWTRDGSLGITTTGEMVKRSTVGWIVVDADDVYVGRFDTRDEAVAAVTR